MKAETGTSRPLHELEIELTQVVQAWKTTTYPTAWKYMSDCAQRVYDPGFIVNPWGRKRRFTGIKEKRADLERQAQNFPIQSTVADTAMLAMDMIAQYRDTHGLQISLTNQIHDAIMINAKRKMLIGECTRDGIEEAKQMFKATMGAIKIPVGGRLKVITLDVDIDVHSRWSEKEKDE